MSGPPPPVGLGYLSYAVKKARCDETLIIEGRRFRLSIEDLLKRAAAFGPDVIGITGMSFEASQAAALISRLKEHWPEIPVIMGGPHATAYGPALMDSIRADYLVIGEGEDTLVELLDALEGKRDLSSVKGVVWRNSKRVTFNGSRRPIEDLSRLGVDWEAIGPENYFGIWNRNAMLTIARSGRRLPVHVNRGCPMRCSYCHNIFGRKYRRLDPKQAVSEMVRLRDKYRLKEFEITEDFFNLELDWAKTFMREVIDRKLGCAIAFPNGLRADRMDDELLDLMVAGGTYYIYYAIESANPRIQKLVHKNLDLERARTVVNMTAARRIVTGTFIMLGFPDETEEEMTKTIDYALSLDHHLISILFLNPFPGTEIAESNPEVMEKVKEIGFRNYFQIPLNLSSVPDDVMLRIKRSAIRRFYFSPRRMFRITRDVPKNRRLLASALLAVKLSFREDVHY
jgi:radical SAM superfamily enzyme YgiQ (UPF0313 family)